MNQPELEAELRTSPHTFEFFQAVRLLQQLLPENEAVGEFVDPRTEVARFGVPASIAFPASQIQALAMEPESQVQILVNFMGLTGPLGVLPYYYTLLMAERERARDDTLREFFDIFHHRIISLFYRAWEKHRFTVGYERDRRDLVTEHLADLVGLGLEAFRDRQDVPDATFFFYAGLLGPRPRSAAALEQLLEDFFAVPIEVEQFVGGWFGLGRDTQCALGDELSASSRLGQGAVAGDEVWDQQGRVRIRIGPLPRARFEEFLPTGAAYAALNTLVRFFSDDQFDFEVQLILARDEVPPCVLGVDDGAATPLGWCTWLRTLPLSRDPDETILTLQS